MFVNFRIDMYINITVYYLNRLLCSDTNHFSVNLS